MRWRTVAGGLFLAAVACVVPAGADAEGARRFFVTGADGRLVIQPRGATLPVTITYRRDDGTYDDAAVERLTHVLKSRDGDERRPPLRLVELLGKVWELAGRRTLIMNSGYRSPDYNEGLRAKGRKAAGGSMHTEAMATDLAIPGADLRKVWLALRDLDCCGAGFYGKNGFIHVDVGRSRFWEAATSGVEKNLSAGNARLFARTDWDIYRTGDPIRVTLHALTLPPVRIARAAAVVGADGARVPVVLDDGTHADGECMEIAMRDAVLRATAPEQAARGPLELRTCEPRVEETPTLVTTNAVEVIKSDAAK